MEPMTSYSTDSVKQQLTGRNVIEANMILKSHNFHFDRTIRHDHLYGSVWKRGDDEVKFIFRGSAAGWLLEVIDGQ